MDAAWEAGITWFDTADAYGGGRSETYIGEWIRSRRPEGLRITTKTFNPMAEGEDHGLAPDRVRRQIDTSLRRLGVERVDLYLAHALGRRRARRRARRRLRGARRRREDRRLRRQQRRRRAAARGARSRRVRRRPELVLAARPRGGGRGAAALRRARALVPGALPAHGRLADGQVPPRRAGAGGLADDAALGAVRAPAHRRRLRRARGARAPRRPGHARARVAARGRACLRRPRPAPPGAPAARPRRARESALAGGARGDLR